MLPILLTIDEVNNLTELLASEYKELGDTSECHGQTIRIHLFDLGLVLEELTEQAKLVLWESLIHRRHIHELHVVELEDSIVRDLPVVLDYKELRVVLLIAEAGFVPHL